MHTSNHDVQALKRPAPQNANHENVARIVSVEEIVAIYADIAAGTAPLSVVYEWAFKAISLASEKVGQADLSKLDRMSAIEARVALGDIKSGRGYLLMIAPAFAEYPEISSGIEGHLNALFYAESLLGPFYIATNKTVVDRQRASSSTYIVQHPLTKHIKIGKTTDVQGRMKALQTGAGAILSVLAVIPGDREQELHRRFSSLRRHGEWFEDMDGSIIEFAKAHGGK